MANTTTRKIIQAAAGLCLLCTGPAAHSAFVLQGGATQNLSSVGNHFDDEILSQGIDQFSAGAQLRVSQDGYIDFYYVGALSGYNNSFTAHDSTGGGSGVLSEHNERFNFSGYDGFSIAVSADEAVNFSFTSDNGSALTPVDNFSGTNLKGLGILFDGSQSGSLSQVLLGYDDQIFNDDDDFDDMMILAEFRPGAGLPEGGLVSAVPLPAAVWLFAGGLGVLVRTARGAARQV
jgi:hypothetical protein